MTGALHAACPKCGAAPGQRCRTMTGTGRTTDTHMVRFAEATRRRADDARMLAEQADRTTDYDH